MRPKPPPNPIHNSMSTIAQQAPTTPLFEGDTGCSAWSSPLAASMANTAAAAPQSGWPTTATPASWPWIPHSPGSQRCARPRPTRPSGSQSKRSISASWASWGYPSTYRHRHRFRNYVHSPWQHSPVKPDLVLIDGRFRVACFLHSLLTAEAGTPILFDDYTNRPHYHLVEEFCPIEQTEGRQALFRVPEELDRERIGKELEGFLMVRD